MIKLWAVWWLTFKLIETLQSGRFTWITPETHLEACIVILIIIWPVWTRAPLFYMQVHPIWVETKISKSWTLSGKIFIDWVYLPGPSIQSISTFYVIFSTFEVMLFAKIPIKLTTKNGMRTLRKKLFLTLVTLGQKIACILSCLNGDDEERYMHSIKSNWMNKKRE